MRHPAKALALLILAASVAGCGSQKQEEPAAAASSAAPSVAVAAPPAAFLQCRSCHSVEPGKNGIGPSLHGIVGRKAGEVPAFAFSTALKQSGVTWDRASLDQWLAAPMKMVPGSKMMVSVPGPVQRKDIVDYLETLK